ncbi:hypothetical protein DLR60_04925 [Vibrio tarriae]|nr:hypothetical protein F0315_09950 [Vibrio cholerae]RBM27190.1 hypothetical protein DLR59_10015 [Vibrio tarriae]RBM30082.1 hypothetical protein DLR61_08710 [Vibrio tarriae]RBM33252.1 hypothetical protein DLR58_12865 [Vibrio tarriae]RBM43885.1 hypothetical protein DLR62_00715 [Vibrio tarriae]
MAWPNAPCWEKVFSIMPILCTTEMARLWQVLSSGANDNLTHTAEETLLAIQITGKPRRCIIPRCRCDGHRFGRFRWRSSVFPHFFQNMLIHGLISEQCLYPLDIQFTCEKFFIHIRPLTTLIYKKLRTQCAVNLSIP